MQRSLSQRIKLCEERLDALETKFQPVRDGEELVRAVQDAVLNSLRFDQSSCDKREEQPDSFVEQSS